MVKTPSCGEERQLAGRPSGPTFFTLGGLEVQEAGPRAFPDSLNLAEAVGPQTHLFPAMVGQNLLESSLKPPPYRWDSEGHPGLFGL